MRKSTKAILAALALGGGVYFGPKVPLIEKIFTTASSFFQSESLADDSKGPTSGKYICSIKEEDNVLIPNKQAMPFNSKRYSIGLSISWGTGSPPSTVSLSSDDQDFDKVTLKVAYSNSRYTSYQKYHTVFDGLREGIGLDLYSTGAITVTFEHDLNKNLLHTKFGGCKPVTDDLIKAVFIRPCEKQLFAENSFGSKNPKVKVDGGNITGVCTDLRNSGVTDLFLPFKADQEGKSCGKQGELLYDSNYNGNESPVFKTSRYVGFDPISTIINTCQNVYSAAGKKLNIHAWVPIFSDRNAAAIAGLRGLTGGFLDFGKSEDKECTSGIFADPSNSKVRRYELKILEEITTKYPSIAGINLDYIRYPDIGDFRASLTNKKCTSADLDIKPDQIESFVVEVRRKFPKLILSADVKAGIGARQSVGQEGIMPYLDIVMPMVYSRYGVDQEVGYYVKTLRADHPKVKIVPDLRGWLYTDASDKPLQTTDEFLADLTKDITSAKDSGAEGYAIFTYEALLNESRSKSLSLIKDKLVY